ncbi:hypothetical protein N665_2545s0002 [Sinapis alba]|nr:hypothetical protein N665_2545s0002 [Sinapis alba]
MCFFFAQHKPFSFFSNTTLSSTLLTLTLSLTTSLFSISSPLLVYNLFVYNLISLLFLCQVRHLSELTRSGLDQDQNECWTQPTAEEEVEISFKHVSEHTFREEYLAGVKPAVTSGVPEPDA